MEINLLSVLACLLYHFLKIFFHFAYYDIAFCSYKDSSIRYSIIPSIPKIRAIKLSRGSTMSRLPPSRTLFPLLASTPPSFGISL